MDNSQYSWHDCGDMTDEEFQAVLEFLRQYRQEHGDSTPVEWADETGTHIYEPA